MPFGSGAGGATTAAVLAEAGFDVLIAEEGDWIEQGAVVPFSLEQMDRQYRAGGVTVALGVPLPSTVALDHPTVAALAAALAERAGGTSDGPDGPDDAADTELAGLLDEIDALADADARSRLTS